jgi:hypothetical protein
MGPRGLRHSAGAHVSQRSLVATEEPGPAAARFMPTVWHYTGSGCLMAACLETAAIWRERGSYYGAVGGV